MFHISRQLPFNALKFRVTHRSLRVMFAYQSGDKVAAMTANGKVVNAMITVPFITVAGLTRRNVKVAVGITRNILIGMNFLGRVCMQMGTGRLVMEKWIRVFDAIALVDGILGKLTLCRSGKYEEAASNIHTVAAGPCAVYFAWCVRRLWSRGC